MGRDLFFQQHKTFFFSLFESQEWSAVAEMAAATEEYFLETQRLQCLLAQRQHVDEAALFPDNDDQWRGDARGDTVVREEYTPPNSRHTRPSVNEPGWDRRRLQENRPAMLRGPTRNVRGRQPQSTDIKAIVRGKDCKDNMHSIDSCSHRRRRSRQSVDEGIMVAPEVPDNGFHGIRTSDGKVYHQRPPSPIRRGSPPRAARMAPRAASIEIVPTSPTSPGARMRPSDREGVGSPDWPGSQGRRNPAIAKRGGTRAQVAKWMASCSAEARAGGMLASRRSRPVSAPSSRDCMDEQPGAASRGDQASWGRRSHNALSPGYKRREDARSRSSVDAHFDDDTVAMASAAGQRANHMPLWTVQSERHGEEMMSADELPDNDASDRMPSPRATPDFGLEGNVPSREHDVPRSTPNEADCTTARRCRHVDGERGGEATATLTHHSREGEKPRGSREDAAENFVHTRTDGSDGGNTPVCVHDNDDNSNGRGEPDKSVTSSTSALLPDDGSDFRSEHHSVASPLESGISLAELGERSVTSGAPSGGEKGVSSIPTAGGLPQSRSSTPYSMPTVSLREWGERETMPPPITTGSRFSSCHGESTTVACCSVTSVVAAGSTHSNASSPSTARNKGRPEKGADAGVGSSVDSQASTVNSAGRQEGSRQRAVAASRLVHDGGGKRAAIEAGKGGGTGEETPPELNGRGQLADAPSTEEAIISTPRGASDEDHHYTQDAVDDDGGTYDVERSLLRESLAEEQPLETDAALRQEANSNSRNSRRTPGTIGDSDDTGNSGNVRASREDDRGYALSALNSGMVSGGGVGAAEAEKDAAVVTDSRGSVGANSGVHDSVSRRRDSSGDSGPLVAVQGQCEITAESKDSSSVVVVVGSEGGGEGSEYGDDFDEEDD